MYFEQYLLSKPHVNRYPSKAANLSFNSKLSTICCYSFKFRLISLMITTIII